MKSNRNPTPQKEPSWREAAYVAWLLRIDPFEVFAIEPETTDEANQHLIDSVFRKLDQLTREIKLVKGFERSPQFLWYCKTVEHCVAVMDCVADPAEHGWFANRQGFRRGMYVVARGRAR